MVLALAAMLGCPPMSAVSVAPAQAAAPPGFFGLGGWSVPTVDQSADLKAAGLGLYRAPLGWQDVQPARDDSYNWTTTDSLATDAAKDGYDLILALNGCAIWACGAIQRPPTGAALDDYRAFVMAAVQRYGKDGVFWDEHPTLPQRTISWQVWNEVNGGTDWPNPTPADYATFLAQISQTIKAADPTATVLLSGLDEFPGESTGMPLKEFLTGLYQQPGFKDSFDVAAVHAYAADPAGAAHVLDVARRVMFEQGDQTRPLWVTEMSWSTGGPPHPFTVTEDLQNQYLAQSWDKMLACRDRWNLKHVLWFALQDVDPLSVGLPDYWGVHNGLLRQDGSAKPSYATFKSYLAPTVDPPCEVFLPGGNNLDITDPDTTITQTPGYTGDTGHQPISFVSNETAPEVHFQCSPDGSPWQNCTSPFDAANGREGDHEIRVRAIDAQGNIDPTPATGTWQLDLSPPNTYLLGRTPSKTAERVLRVDFESRDAYGVSGAQCNLDGQGWAPCSSPYLSPQLAPGAHNVGVRSVDFVGRVDPEPLSLNFTILDDQGGKPTFALGSRTVKVDTKGKGTLELKCTSRAGDLCAAKGKMSLRVTVVVSAKVGKKKKTKQVALDFGTVAGGVDATRTGKLTVRVSKVGRDKLMAGKGRRLTVTLTGKVAGRAGLSAPLSDKVTLVPPKPKPTKKKKH